MGRAPVFFMTGKEARVRSLSGRCLTGSESESGKLWHVVVEETGRAACGAKPGFRSNGWTDIHDRAPTCPRCIKRLEI
jgi:hypothetical protein